MTEYIKREDVIDLITRRYENPEICTEEINQIPAADVVPGSTYEQVVWERDTAIRQLKEDYGVGLGQKKSKERTMKYEEKKKYDPIYYKVAVNKLLKQAKEHDLVVEGEIKFKATNGECAIAKLKE